MTGPFTPAIEKLVEVLASESGKDAVQVWGEMEAFWRTWNWMRAMIEADPDCVDEESDWRRPFRQSAVMYLAGAISVYPKDN